MHSDVVDGSGERADREDLAKLAAELTARGLLARLAVRPGQPACLQVRNPQVARMTEQISARGEYFLWSWQQPIARRDQPAAAAAAISRVLSAIVPPPRSSD